jgi:Xaa-Pro dipeptidase
LFIGRNAPECVAESRQTRLSKHASGNICDWMTTPTEIPDDYSTHLARVLAAVNAALLEAGADAMVIEAGRQHIVFQDDQAYPYRPSPWYQWLAPAPAAPGSLILLQNNELPELLLVTPEDFWHAPPTLPTAAWTRHFHLVALPSAQAALDRALTLPGKVVWMGESASPGAGWVANPPRLLARLELERAIKSSYELQCMREASLVGARGHQAAARAFQEGRSEFDIHLAFLAATAQNETELPYGSIVALNEHCATLHYQLRDRAAPRQLNSLLIDAGASAAGYASDITRTWAARPGHFASLVQGMDQLQLQLCGQVRAGVDWRDLHMETHGLIASLLREADLLHMSPDEAVATGVSARFLPHGLGHLLGLQVHDVGGFRDQPEGEPIPRPPGHPALRLTRRLQPGMVVTVEPGLYFIDSLLRELRAGPQASRVNWALVDELKPCGGIRIEDNVVVRADRGENLTRAAFAGLPAG